MSSVRSIPDSRRAEFARDWESQATLRDLAAKYGCSIATISNTAKIFDLPHRVSGGKDTDSPPVLSGGEWVMNERGVRVWRE